MRHASRSRRGYVLMAFALSALAVVGMVGLSVDLGRLYIAKQEAQAFVDAASVAATLELDGTTAGIDRAKVAARADINRWNFGNTPFPTPVVEFAAAATGPFSINPATASGVRFTRVTAQADQSNYLLPVLKAPLKSTARARAVAGQIERTQFGEGAFPFSPMVHDESDPNFGFTPGQEYTLRWPPAPKDNKNNVCAGDRHNQWINKAEEGSSSERGFIEEPDAATIKLAVEGDYQTRPLEVGGTVIMSDGGKQTILDSLMVRIGQDSDTRATMYGNYEGNGRRLVVVPVNTWYPDFRIVGFASFLLLRANEYNKGGNQGWCAEYVGPWVQGSKTKGGGQGAGAYVVRLVE